MQHNGSAEVSPARVHLRLFLLGELSYMLYLSLIFQAYNEEKQECKPPQGKKRLKCHLKKKGTLMFTETNATVTALSPSRQTGVDA